MVVSLDSVAPALTAFPLREAEQVADTAVVDQTTASGAFELQEVSVAYGAETVVAGVTMSVKSHQVTALIGPSGCGKSTLLRCLNRMNDEIGNVHVGGRITLDGRDIYEKGADPVEIRAMVGQVFQKPNPFPMSIWDNVAYGPRTLGIRNRSELDAIIEDTIAELRTSVTIVIVTHNMQQAARISDTTAFMLRSKMDEPAVLVEVGDTRTMFTNPGDTRTEAYITGRFG